MAKAGDRVRGLPQTQVQAKVRLSKVEQIHGQFEGRFCQRCLIESGKRLATRMRREHVAVIAIRSHLAAARGFIVGRGAGQHTREERSHRQKPDDEANPEFGEALQLNRAYPQLPSHASYAGMMLSFALTSERSFEFGAAEQLRINGNDDSA